MKDDGIEMIGVTEYAEGYKVRLVTTTGSYESGKPEDQWQGRGRLAVRALNEGGHSATEIDLIELIAWVKANRPEMLA